MRQTAKVIAFPAPTKRAPAVTFQTLIRRHRKARAAEIKARWDVTDHPSAPRPMIQMTEITSWSNNSCRRFNELYTRKQIGQAVRAYLRHCRKVGEFRYRTFCGRTIPFNAATLKEYRKEIRHAYDTLEFRLEKEAEANKESGHTDAFEAWCKVGDAESAAWRAIGKYVSEYATLEEIGKFASYTRAVVNHNFDAHMRELRIRREKKQPDLPSAEDLADLDDWLYASALEKISKATRRASGARARKAA